MFSTTAPETAYDNAAFVHVPQLYVSDRDLFLQVAQVGVTSDGAARFAYVVWDGDDASPIAGEDLCGPAAGTWPEAEDMANVLAGFLGAAYECGEVTEHGESYSPEELEWLEEHADRFQMMSYMAAGEYGSH